MVIKVEGESGAGNAKETDFYKLRSVYLRFK